MKIFVCRTLLVFAVIASPSWAGVITGVSFTSNSGLFVNNTIVDGTTSPLGFTNTTSLSEPFLNAADSTVSLGYGTYYAIAFLGFGAHQGAGTVAFVLDGVTPFSQAVTFPDPSVASGNFATFALPGSDSVTISATGLAADRIRIIADGGGLFPDGVNPDAFYLFTYTSGIAAAPEPRLAILAGFGIAMMALGRKR